MEFRIFSVNNEPTNPEEFIGFQDALPAGFNLSSAEDGHFIVSIWFSYTPSNSNLSLEEFTEATPGTYNSTYWAIFERLLAKSTFGTSPLAWRQEYQGDAGSTFASKIRKIIVPVSQ